MHRTENKFRIFRMWFLLNCFDVFTRRKLYESVIGNNSTYQDKEKTAGLINLLFDSDCKPSDLNRDDNETADKAIALDNELKSFMKYSYTFTDGMSDDDIFAFLNSLENDSKLIWVKIHHLQYPKAMQQIILYYCDAINYSEYQASILKWHNSKFPFTCNLRHMTKSLVEAEKYLLKLLQKRESRLKNKRPN